MSDTFRWEGADHTLAGECPACWAGSPEICGECDGRLHTEFGDEWSTAEDEGYWLIYRCQQCGSTLPP